jgi:energy-coupling factor transporter ATP-binding protein EcfA2
MITAFRGPNFSGRSTLMRRQTFFGEQADAKPKGSRYAYFDLQVPSYFSGIASTVAQELHLSTAGANSDLQLIAQDINYALDFERLHARNPYVLSGGEQSVLGVLVALLLEPRAIGIDCALEQLSPQWRNVIIAALSESLENIDDIYLADNRLAEIDALLQKHISFLEMAPQPAPVPTIKSQLPSFDICPCRISVDKLRFRYQQTQGDILANLDFEFVPGTIYQLSGPNGIGKSTLSKLLAGILSPSAGRFLMEGRKQINLTQQPGRYFAYHFQNPDYQLFSTSTSREVEISLPSPSHQLLEWLDCFGLTQFAKVHPLDISYSLRKRLALAATFAMQRPWLILDEPSLGQDRVTTEAICALCRAYVARGAGIIVISHSLQLEQFLGVTKITLREGRLW